MNTKLEKYRNSLTNTNRYFYGKVRFCKSPKEVRDLIVTQVRGCSSITSYNIIYVSTDSEIAKAECQDWQIILNNLEKLFFEFAKEDGYLLERFSNENNSTAIILPAESNTLHPIHDGIILDGIESIIFYKTRLNFLLEKFIYSSENLIT